MTRSPSRRPSTANHGDRHAGEAAERQWLQSRSVGVARADRNHRRGGSRACGMALRWNPGQPAHAGRLACRASHLRPTEPPHSFVADGVDAGVSDDRLHRTRGAPPVRRLTRRSWIGAALAVALFVGGRAKAQSLSEMKRAGVGSLTDSTLLLTSTGDSVLTRAATFSVFMQAANRFTWGGPVSPQNGGTGISNGAGSTL